MAVAEFVLVFCLKELFALNCHLHLLKVMGEDERRRFLSLENPLRHYNRMH